jgi:hypothetical protein
VLRHGQEIFVSILNQGIADGEFSEKLDPAIYAFKAVAAVEGAVVMCRIDEHSKADGRLTQEPESRVRKLCDIVFFD